MDWQETRKLWAQGVALGTDGYTYQYRQGSYNAFDVQRAEYASKLKNLAEARRNEPGGVVCAYCGGENTFADDCGFFYCSVGKGLESKPTCEKCFRGKIGDAHIALYGLGDR